MTLKFDKIKIDKKNLKNKSKKKTIDLNLVDTNKIVISDKYELDEGGNITLATKMVNLLDHYALFYLK